MRAVRGSRKPRLCFRSNQDSNFLPCGLHFVKITNEPWTMNFSRSQIQKYFFNSNTNESLFECLSDSIASFRDGHKTRLLWKWEDGVVIHDVQSNRVEDKLSKEDILKFVQRKREIINGHNYWLEDWSYMYEVNFRLETEGCVQALTFLVCLQKPSCTAFNITIFTDDRHWAVIKMGFLAKYGKLDQDSVPWLDKQGV